MPNEFYVKNTTWDDVCMWDPSLTKTQVSIVTLCWRSSSSHQMLHYVMSVALFILIVCLHFSASRTTGQSHSVVQTAHFLLSSFLLIRATFAMFTVKTLRIESFLTARIALTMGTRRPWRPTSDSFTYPTMRCARGRGASKGQ